MSFYDLHTANAEGESALAKLGVHCNKMKKVLALLLDTSVDGW
jgi:hypothetical protein